MKGYHSSYPHDTIMQSHQDVTTVVGEAGGENGAAEVHFSHRLVIRVPHLNNIIIKSVGDDVIRVPHLTTSSVHYIRSIGDDVIRVPYLNILSVHYIRSVGGDVIRVPHLNILSIHYIRSVDGDATGIHSWSTHIHHCDKILFLRIEINQPLLLTANEQFTSYSRQDEHIVLALSVTKFIIPNRRLLCGLK